MKSIITKLRKIQPKTETTGIPSLFWGNLLEWGREGFSLPFLRATESPLPRLGEGLQEMKG
jgi:hypothetical protein